MTPQDALLRMHLRLETDEVEYDPLIQAYISAARELTETYLRRRLIQQTVRLTRNGFGRSGIRLPVAPIRSVVQVQYLDDAGDWQTVDDATYRLVDADEPGELELEPGQCWPTPRPGKATVRIDMVVGYGEMGSSVPPRFLQAIREQIAHMFEHKGDAGQTGELAPQAERFLCQSVLWV